MIQKSYEDCEFGKLYLIPTPIGNMEDITLRAINTLKMVDIIYAEDTRNTLNLLKQLNISKKVESCHKYSEMMHRDKIIKILKEGKNIGYVTDRGTPLISDPGNVIVDACIKEKISVIALPGASALLPALNMSGISNEKFIFYGFLNNKSSIAKQELIQLKDYKYTLIFYEAPHRIKNTMELMLQVFGDRNASIVREISKLHEEVLRNKISDLLKLCDKIKGEMVIVIEGNNKLEDSVNYKEKVVELINKGYSKKDAVHEIADQYNISKNKIYNELFVKEE